MIDITIPIRTRSEANMRGHWGCRARRMKTHRTVSRMALQVHVNRLNAAGWSRLVVTITRLAPRELDSDNLAISSKGVRDGIADAIGLDDRDPRVTWNYGQAHSDAKNYAVRIRIEKA